MKTATLVVALLACVAALTTGIAAATTVPFTRGDAQAVFNAGPGGGAAVGSHGGVIEGAPAEGVGKRVGPGPNFEGFHICATDWHLLSVQLALTDSINGGGVQNVNQARLAFGTLEVTYELDGSPLPIDTTATKPLLNPTSVDPEATKGFFQSWGAILAPTELSVGPHIEHVVIYEAGIPIIDFGEVTFVVDAPGTGACL